MIAEDPAGNTGAAYACAIVDGGMKLGQLAFGVEDLSSPQLGMPLTLARQYDSRAQGPGDLGTGWNLPSSDVKAQMTLPLGKGWSQQPGAGAFGIATYFLMELRQHIVVIRFSDEDVIKFKKEWGQANNAVSKSNGVGPCQVYDIQTNRRGDFA